MKKLILPLLCLTLAFSFSTPASASALSDLFSNLFKPAAPKVAPQAVFNASLDPYISLVALKDENVCSVPLADKDLQQMKYDQFLIHSLLDLHKVDESLPVSSVNLYMSVLLQKLRATVELDNPEDQDFLKKLNQTDFQVANFAAASESILKLGNLISAHQSLELGSYNVDGFLKIAIEGYIKCAQGEASCNSSEKLWSKWFEQNGFGLVDPLINKGLLESNALSEADMPKISSANFKVNIPVGEYKSELLVKSVFELLNVYGGENFDYFSFMAGEKLKAEQGSRDGVINAPGKVVGGLLLKLANQRIVAYYKYQKCRLLSQNTANVNIVEQLFTNSVNGAGSSGPAPSGPGTVVSCLGVVCPAGTTAVTTGSNAVGVVTNNTGTASRATCDSGNESVVSTIAGNGPCTCSWSSAASGSTIGATCNAKGSMSRKCSSDGKWINIVKSCKGTSSSSNSSNASSGSGATISTPNAATTVTNSSPVTTNSAADSCSAGQIHNGTFCFTCLEGWEPNPTKTGCMGTESFCSKPANYGESSCYIRRREATTVTNSSPATTNSAADSCSPGQIHNGTFCFTCLEGWEPNPTKTGCMGTESFCSKPAKHGESSCFIRRRELAPIEESSAIGGATPQAPATNVNSANAPANAPEAKANFMSICGTGSNKDRDNITRDQAKEVCNQCDDTIAGKFAICKWGSEIIRNSGDVPQAYINRINTAN